jgi:hypothetical protein
VLVMGIRAIEINRRSYPGSLALPLGRSGKLKMEIRHRIIQFQNDPKFNTLKTELDRLNRKCYFTENKPLSFIEYTFSDQDPLSEQLLDFVKSNDLYIQSALYYSDAEIMDAEWVTVEVGEFQYPQPEDSYKGGTYDLSDYCEICGHGKVQDKPFRLKRDFVQKQAKFLGLHWVFDEIFVRPEICRIFNKAGITGVSYAEVIHHKTNQILENVYQMKINLIAEPGLVTDELFTVTCKPNNEESHIEGLRPSKENSLLPYCGRIKYHYPLIKPIKFMANALKDLPDFVKSYEYIGSGGGATRFILARNRVVRVIKEKGLRGLGFRRPVHLVDT